MSGKCTREEVKARILAWRLEKVLIKSYVKTKQNPLL